MKEGIIQIIQIWKMMTMIFLNWIIRVNLKKHFNYKK